MRLKNVKCQSRYSKLDKGELTEVFGSGTAAVISPVGTLKHEDRNRY